MARWYFMAWVIAEVLLVIACGAAWIAAPEFWMFNIALSVFTAGLGVLLLYPRRVDFVTWLRSRQFRAALEHLGRFFLVAAIVALLNHLAWKFPWRADWTSQSLNSLSNQSRQALASLAPGTKITLFARREDWRAGMALLGLYRDVRPELLLTAIDLEAQPRLARAAGVQANGTVLLEQGDKRVLFALKDELSVTNALLRLARGQGPKVYFTEGHGEAACANDRDDGLSAFCGHLRDQLFELSTFDLQRAQDVPADAALIVLWGPRAAFLGPELQRLQRYLEKGGALLWAAPPDFQADHFSNLRAFIARWGLKAHNDLVVDRLSTVENAEATTLIVSNYEGNHPVIRGFDTRTVFPLSSSVETVQPLYQGVATSVLVATSAFPGSWAERDLTGVTKGQARYDEGRDVRGPIGILATAERRLEGVADTRVAVVGNDAWVRNGSQGQTGNMNLALNLVGWLAHDEGLIALDRPGLSRPPVVLSRSHLHVVFFLAVVTIPLVAFGLALWTYRRRRRL